MNRILEAWFGLIEAEFEDRPTMPGRADGAASWFGIQAHDRARPLTDLGRRLLGLHVATTTPKEN